MRTPSGAVSAMVLLATACGSAPPPPRPAVSAVPTATVSPARAIPERQPRRWTFETIRSRSIHAASIAHDSKGALYLAAADYSGRQATLVLRRDGVDAWAEEVRLPFASYVSLAIDERSVRHLIGVADIESRSTFASWRAGDPPATPGLVVEKDMYLDPTARLAVTRDGQPHYCFTTKDGAVGHAFPQSGAWKVETVAPDGRTCAIALGPTGSLAIAFARSGGTLSIATRGEASSPWAVEDIAKGSMPALAIAPDGAFHVAFQAPSEKKVRLAYARRSRGAWTPATLPPIFVPPGEPIALALGPDGTPQLAFHEEGEGTEDGHARTTVRYGAYADDRWTFDEVAPSVADVLAMTADGRGTPHLVFVDRGTSALMHAYPAATDARTLDQARVIGAVRACGRARIASTSVEGDSAAFHDDVAWCERVQVDLAASKAYAKTECEKNDRDACYAAGALDDVLTRSFSVDFVDHGKVVTTATHSTGNPLAEQTPQAALALPGYVRGCEAGHRDACLRAGMLLEPSAEPERAAGLFRKACALESVAGCAKAIMKVGHEPARDPALFADAASRFKAHCERGDALACNDLGFLAARGEGVAKDAREATRLYLRACELGDGFGCINWLWTMHGQAAPAPKDALARVAAAVTERCEAASDADACGALAIMLVYGMGMKKDVARAKELYATCPTANDRVQVKVAADIPERTVCY